MRALVIGGTGPTGPHVVSGLRAGDMTSLSSIAAPTSSPRWRRSGTSTANRTFAESIAAALAGREFDIVVAMYGRTRHLAPALAGWCDRFISIGGVPVYRGYFPRPGEPALPIPVIEAHPVAGQR